MENGEAMSLAIFWKHGETMSLTGFCVFRATDKCSKFSENPGETSAFRTVKFSEKGLPFSVTVLKFPVF